LSFSFLYLTGDKMEYVIGILLCVREENIDIQRQSFRPEAAQGSLASVRAREKSMSV